MFLLMLCIIINIKFYIMCMYWSELKFKKYIFKVINLVVFFKFLFSILNDLNSYIWSIYIYLKIVLCRDNFVCLGYLLIMNWLDIVW